MREDGRVSARVIRFAGIPVSPWANGLGETVELWRTPQDGAFAVRLSVATVTTATPFSPLPGVDRVLMPLAPTGLTVRVGDSTYDVPQYETLRFDGGEDAASLHVRVPGRDLNLMVRRGTGIADLVAVQVDGTYRVNAHRVRADRGRAPGFTAVVAVEGAVTFGGVPLRFGDTIVADVDVDVDAGAITVHGGGRIAVARVC